MNPETLPKVASTFCWWAGIASWVACFYCLIFAPIEYVVPGIILFGAAVGLQLIATLLKRGAKPGNGEAGTPPQG